MNGTAFGCTKCQTGKYLLGDVGYCASECPSGYSTVAGVCTPSGTLNWSFNFDQPKSDFSAAAGDITIVGGFADGTPFIDDPFPATGRGAWFNGDIDHYTVNGLTLNHSFTIEFFLKPHEEYCTGTGTIYASYKTPFCWDKGSVYKFGLNQRKLTFTEMPSRVALTAYNSNVNNGVWTHVGLTL